jgi:uncharacterized protein YyaL (SSP411 family)
MVTVSRKANRLANEKSPYLLQHAHNPVEWFAWGEEAFEKARRDDLPIFLSVGYSTCHWCHVMERESFENGEIAELLNRHFVSIKVDREELPDLDRLYMHYLHSTTGQGGWPMSVWLTPDRKPFYGGTYFPPQDRYGIAGFTTVLLSLARLWRSDRKKIMNAAQGFVYMVEDVTRSESSDLPADDQPQRQCFEWLASTFDPLFGGFGGAPKFPRPVLLNFLFNEAYHSGNKRALDMALKTLVKMAEGGIHDQLGVQGKGGGGFARYSTDARWQVPHFEKMLYDNAQLALSYLEAFQCSGDAFYKTVARDIFNYVLCDMTSPEGGFYSAEDADSLEDPSGTIKKEGAFYLWSADELHEHLADEQLEAMFSFTYGIKAKGNTENDPYGEFIGKNILMQQASVEETAERFGKTAAEVVAALDVAREKLFTARAGRPRPFLDDKILTSWNGLMVSALAKGYRVLHDDLYLVVAKKAVAFILDKLYSTQQGRLLRRYRDGHAAIPGKAEDYAFLVQALLDLYEASFEASYLQWALDLADLQNTLFYDNSQGGYFSTAFDDNTVPLRLKENDDGAEPSANSVSTLNLLRLGAITGREEFTIKAEQTIACFGSTLRESSHALPQMLVALNFARKRKSRVILSGELHHPEMARLRAVVDERYLPGNVMIHASRELAALVEFSETLQSGASSPQASLCIDHHCLLPVDEPEKLAVLLESHCGSAIGQTG